MAGLEARSAAVLPLRDQVAIRREAGRRPLRYGGEYVGLVERLGGTRRGSLELSPEGLHFLPDDGSGPLHWPISRIRAVGASSTSLQLAVEGEPLRAIRLQTTSLRLWEELLEDLIRRQRCAPDAPGDVVEFLPRITMRDELERRAAGSDSPAATRGDPALAEAHAGEAGRGRHPTADHRSKRLTEETPKHEGNPLYRTLQRLVPVLARVLAGPLSVVGRENIPRTGPFLLIPNHQSFIDPIIVQAISPRPVYTMTKSTEFSAPGLGAVLPALLAFPAHRFEVDPQVVRRALRLLDDGRPVSIYMEGERSWDGRLQSPRLGTLRLILKAGVPVIPCGISGSYDVLPRWDHALRRAPIRVAFGAPMHFPQSDDRAEREALLADVARRLSGAIRELAGQD